MTAALKNPQSNRLYVPAAVRKSDVAAKRLLHTTSTFSQSLMVSVGVSKLGHTGLKISSLESRWMEPTTVTFCCCNICYRTDSHVAGEFFIFQLDSAPAHRAHETILNARLLLSFCWICSRWTAQTSIQLTIKFRAWCSNESTRRKCRMWTIWDSVWLTCGREWYKALLTTPLTSGADVCVHMFRRGHWIFTVTC